MEIQYDNVLVLVPGPSTGTGTGNRYLWIEEVQYKRIIILPGTIPGKVPGKPGKPVHYCTGTCTPHLLGTRYLKDTQY